MLKPGTILDERYEISDIVGTGGMSTVYRAKDSRLNRYVAIKVLKSEYSNDAGFVSRFRVEAQASAGLTHPNVVSVYDVCEDNGRYFIVMELVEGITLKEFIHLNGRLSMDQALDFSIQIASGLEAAHEHHVIHRDIKPQNIIVSKNGNLKVTDFGIAKAATSNTMSTAGMGSVHYISPEQARGGYSDERSDIYSLGITMYEMVTGRVPFEGDTNVAIALMHIQSEIVPPRQYYPDIYTSFEKIILKATQKKPERRYLTAAALIADLKRVKTNPNIDIVVAPPTVPTSPTQRFSTSDIHRINSEVKNAGQQGAAQQGAAQSPVQGGVQNPLPRRTSEVRPDRGRIDQLIDEADDYDDYYDDYDDSSADPGPVKSGKNGGRYPDRGRYRDQDYDDDYYPDDPDYDDGYDDDYDDGYDGGHDQRSSEGRSDDYDDRGPRKNGNGSRPAAKRPPVSQPPKRPAGKPIKKVEDEDDYDDYDYQERRKKEEDEGVDPKLAKAVMIGGIAAAVIVAVIILIIVGNVMGWFKFGSSSTESTVVQNTESTTGAGTAVNPVTEEPTTETEKVLEMPEVEGYSQRAAEKSLKDRGFFNIKIETAYDDKIPLEFVISANYKRGEKLPESAEIVLTVSLGAEEAVVPDVTGYTDEQASTVLQEAGFTVQHSFEYSETVDKDKIIRTNPEKNSTAAKGSKVILVVSNGSEVKKVQVPKVTDISESAANSSLEAVKLSVGSVTHEFSDVEAGLVIRQSLAEGAIVDEGSKVDLVVSDGPQVITYTGSVVGSISATNEEYLARETSVTAVVYIVDGSGSHEVVNLTVNNEDKASISLSGNVSGLSASDGTVSVTVTDAEGTDVTEFYQNSLTLTFTQE